MKKRKLGIKPADIIIFCLILAATTWSAYKVYGKNTGKTLLRIESPQGSWLYPLDENRTIAIPGILGETIVKIENDRASIIASPCPNQTCLAGTKITSHGDWNACLPNRVILRGEGSTIENDIDIIVQ